MEKSLERILTEFKSFATKHKQISSYSDEIITEYIAKNWIYPIMWVDYSGMGVSPAPGNVSLSIPVYFLDRVKKDQSNLATVMSSNLIKALQFITQYNDNECTYGFYFTDTPSIAPEILQFDDIVSGWRLTVSLNVGYSRNELLTPLA